jgi:acyl-CoA thioesterase YciA
MPENAKPQGELVIRTFAMPRDTNANGDIFGGWLLSQMDIGAAIIAKERCQGRTTTVAIDAMTFIRPVKVGDTVSVYAKLIKTGRTSMTIGVEAWTSSHNPIHNHKVTEGIFTYVAIDIAGRPRPLD